MPLGVSGGRRGADDRTGQKRHSLRSAGGKQTPEPLSEARCHVMEAPPPEAGGAGPRVTSVPAGTQDGCAPIEVTFE